MGFGGIRKKHKQKIERVVGDEQQEPRSPGDKQQDPRSLEEAKAQAKKALLGKRGKRGKISAKRKKPRMAGPANREWILNRLKEQRDEE